jgi:hypothetical protein
VHTQTIRWLTAITAAALLLTAITTTTAAARNLSTSEQSFRITFSSLEFAAEVSTIRCRLTLEGSFHTRTIAKVTNSLVGAITRGIFAHPGCTGGEFWIDNGTEAEPLGTAPNRLPFHIQYGSFTGTLPNISAVNLLLSRTSIVMQSTFFGLSCRGRYGRPEDQIRIVASREAGGGITSLVPSGTTRLVEQLGNAAVCPSELRFGGTGTIVNLSTGARLTITLI